MVMEVCGNVGEVADEGWIITESSDDVGADGRSRVRGTGLVVLVAE
jgi:hypothetical protein